MSALRNFFTDLRQRKLTRTLLAYGAVGWAILEGIERYGGFLPDAVTTIAPILFLLGIPYCLILGWFHGEKGRQRVSVAEASLLAVATAAAVAVLWLGAPFGAQGSDADDGADLYRIGVLPFSSMAGADGDLAGFGEALSRELNSALARVEALEVAPDRAVAPYRDQEASLDSVARALGVRLLVGGFVARSGDSVVVRPTLYEASAEGRTLWNERFAEPLEGQWDWSLIERVSRDLAAALTSELGAQIRLREWRAETDSHEAWQLLQRAHRHRDVAWDAFLDGEAAYAADLLDRADSLLAEVTRLDDGWAEPHLLRGRLSERRALLDRFFPGRAPGAGPAAILEGGLGHVDRALEIEPANARAWELRGTLGLARLSFGDVRDPGTFHRIESEAVSDLQRAVEIDPFLATAWSRLAGIHLARGDFEQAARAAEIARSEDAFLERPVESRATLAEAWFELGREERALELTREEASRFQGTAFPELELEILAWGDRVPADVERGWELVDRILEGPEAGVQSDLEAIQEMKMAGVLARAGLADSARAVMERAHRVAPDDRRVLRREAAVLARLGEEERAVRLIEGLLADYPARPGRLLSKKMFDPLRDNPRFRALGAG